MKIFGIMFLMTAAFLFQCEKNESIKANDNSAVNISNQTVNSESSMTDPMNSSQSNQNLTNANMKEVFNHSGKYDGVEYRFTGKMQKKGKYDGINYPNDNLVIEYSLKNTGTKNFIVYNQGHSDNSDRSIVYIEPQPSGTIELSQRLFTEPKDKNCPEWDMPITPRAGWLKAGQNMSEKVFVEFPLELKTPFQACTPATQMPANLKKVKFCIGIAEALDAKTSIDKNGIIQNRNVSEQKLLCSDEFALD